MSEREVVNTLSRQAKIESGFTEIGNFYFLFYLSVESSYTYYFDMHTFCINKRSSSW